MSVAAKKGTSLAVEKGPRVWLRSELWQYAEGGELTSTRAAHSTELPYGKFSCPGATVLFACAGSRLYSSYLLSELSLQVKENLQIIFAVRIFPASGGAVVSLRLSISLPNSSGSFRWTVAIISFKTSSTRRSPVNATDHWRCGPRWPRQNGTFARRL